MNLRSLLKVRKSQRSSDPEIGIDTWASWFNFNGNTYPSFNGYGESGKSESIPNDFVGYVNGAYKASGVVFAVCLTRMLIFSEARFAFQEFGKTRPGELIDGPGLELLETPWLNGTAGDLLARSIQDVDLAGNAYWLREDKPGQKPRLRRLRPDWVTIVLSADPSEALSSDILGYIYKPGNAEDPEKWEAFPIDGSNGVVAHWSPIPDPEAQYRGMSWLTPVLREVQADKAISRHKGKFFEKAATPNIAVSLDSTVTPDKFREFKQIMDAQYNGVDNAYKTMYLGGGADVTTIGANIQQMDFKTVTSIGENRIAAAGRVHPSIVGLTSGLEGSSLNEGNFAATRESLASGTMRPLWRTLCAALQPLIDLPKNARLWIDDRDVAFLREDLEKVANRQQIQATTISRYVMQGYTPDSAVACVMADDLSLLKHTGLYSVQLLPPEISFADVNASKADSNAKAPADGKTSGPSKANNNPTGSKRKPVGRPPKQEAKASDPWLEALTRGEPFEDST